MLRKNLIIFLFISVWIQLHPTAIKNSVDICNDCKIQLKAGYVCWWLKHSPEPIPLVITSQLLPNFFASSSNPQTVVVLGDDSVNLNHRSGGRFELSGWINNRFGLGGSYLFLPSKSKSIYASSDGQPGSPFLVFPFFDAVANVESSTEISLPEEYAGSAKLKIKNNLQKAEGNVLYKLYCKNPVMISLSTGFQWWNFDEKLLFSTTSSNIAPPENIFETTDCFKTYNNFYGGLLGLNCTLTETWLQLNVLGKLALGVMNSKLNIQGKLITNNFNGFSTPEVFPAGYLALSTNEGSFNQNCFSVLPEIDINVGLQLTKRLTLLIGYTFLYATKVLWPGNTIDDILNTSQAPAITKNSSTELIGIARPNPLFKREDFWAQGLNIEFKFCF